MPFIINLEILIPLFFSLQVVSSEFIIHHSSPGSDLQLKKISNQLTKTWSSPFLYNPQAPRVPPIPCQDSGGGDTAGKIYISINFASITPILFKFLIILPPTPTKPPFGQSV